MHAFAAAWKLGLWGLMLGGISKLPLALGSGKFETPCERMHWANFKRPVSPVLPWLGETLPAGWYFLQACRAAWKVGEFGLIPVLPP